jgi:hypothetical protein
MRDQRTSISRPRHRSMLTPTHDRIGQATGVAADSAEFAECDVGGRSRAVGLSNMASLRAKATEVCVDGAPHRASDWGDSSSAGMPLTQEGGVAVVELARNGDSMRSLVALKLRRHGPAVPSKTSLVDTGLDDLVGQFVGVGKHELVAARHLEKAVLAEPAGHPLDAGPIRRPGAR